MLGQAESLFYQTNSGTELPDRSKPIDLSFRVVDLVPRVRQACASLRKQAVALHTTQTQLPQTTRPLPSVPRRVLIVDAMLCDVAFIA